MPNKRVDNNISKGRLPSEPLDCSKSNVYESLPKIITPEELQKAVSKYMTTFVEDKKTWIDKYGLTKANKIMYQTAVKKAKAELQKEEPINEITIPSTMNKDELRAKIEVLAKEIYSDMTSSEEVPEYDELTKFPELKNIIVDLLTNEYHNFISTIDWVAPRPTTFRINLKNGYDFYLIYGKRSWISQIEGKKYYLLNLPEEQRAAEAISRILRYGSKEEIPEGGEGGDGVSNEFSEIPPPEEEIADDTAPDETEA